jgi:hypothetical protein
MLFGILPLRGDLDQVQLNYLIHFHYPHHLLRFILLYYNIVFIDINSYILKLIQFVEIGASADLSSAGVRGPSSYLNIKE